MPFAKTFDQSSFLVSLFAGGPSVRVVHTWENVIAYLVKMKAIRLDVIDDLHGELLDFGAWAESLDTDDCDDRCAFLSGDQYIAIVRMGDRVDADSSGSGFEWERP